MTIARGKIALNQVYSIAETQEKGVYKLLINITDAIKETYDCHYISRPDDTFGLNPTIRQWMANNPGFTVGAYQPPIADEARAAMPPLSARQLRLGLVSTGFNQAQVAAVIEALPASDREAAQIEWEYATTFNRTHTLVSTVGAALGISDEQIDTMWAAALEF
ncbi:hypothetical protein M1D34_05105 [Ensifer sp. D2-11]